MQELTNDQVLQLLYAEHGWLAICGVIIFAIGLFFGIVALIALSRLDRNDNWIPVVVVGSGLVVASLIVSLTMVLDSGNGFAKAVVAPDATVAEWRAKHEGDAQ